MNNAISMLIGVLVIVGVGGFVLWQKNAQDGGNSTTATQNIELTAPPQDSSQTVTSMDDDDDDDDDFDDDPSVSNSGGTQTQTPPSNASGITASVIATHSSRTSCWTSINGSVYDLTAWIPKHPGGEQAILQLCGGDGSSKFNRQHGGDAAKEKVLFGFKIGTLAQ